MDLFLNDRVRYLTTDKELNDAFSTIALPSILFLDTEFTRKTTYWPILELIQIIVDDTHIFVIDCQTIQDFSPLVKFLENHHCVKALYSSRQDLEAIWKHFGVYMKNVIDLQTAAAFMGYGLSVGLSDVIESTFNLSINKNEQFSEWSKRPLRQAQIDYAAMDVFYVQKLHPYLLNVMDKLGYRSWMMDAILSSEVEKTFIPDPMQAWVRLKNHVKNDKSLYYLFYLAALREQMAQEWNVIRGSIMIDGDLVKLCDTLAHRHSLSEDDDLVIVNKELDELFTRIHQKAATLFKNLIQKTVDNFEKRPKKQFKNWFRYGPKPTLNPKQHEHFMAIKNYVGTVANQMTIPSSLLASSSLIDSYVRLYDTMLDKEELQHPLVKGWRRIVLPKILELST